MAMQQLANNCYNHRQCVSYLTTIVDDNMQLVIKPGSASRCQAQLLPTASLVFIIRVGRNQKKTNTLIALSTVSTILCNQTSATLIWHYSFERTVDILTTDSPPSDDFQSKFLQKFGLYKLKSNIFVSVWVILSRM